MRKIHPNKKPGPKIFLPSGSKIPLGRHINSLASATLCIAAPAWMVETTPNLKAHPNNANYYHKTFNNALYRRHCWQYMFAGLLRSMFGIYCPSRYWNKELETSLSEHIRDQYIDQKRRGVYGIYNFRTRKAFCIRGRRWYAHAHPPETPYPFRKFIFYKNADLCIRINRLDWEKGCVDIEGRDHKYGTLIVRSTFEAFTKILKAHKLKPMNEDFIYDTEKCYRLTKTMLKQAGKNFRRLPPLSKTDLSFPEKSEG